MIDDRGGKSGVMMGRLHADIFFQDRMINEVGVKIKLVRSKKIFLVERYYITFGLWHEPSVCRLSVVFNVVAPKAKIWNFSAIFLHHVLAQGLGQFVLKFWAKIRRDSRRSCKLNTRGYENWRFSTNISLYLENGTRYGHS